MAAHKTQGNREPIIVLDTDEHTGEVQGWETGFEAQPAPKLNAVQNYDGSISLTVVTDDEKLALFRQLNVCSSDVQSNNGEFRNPDDGYSWLCEPSQMIYSAFRGLYTPEAVNR